MYDRDFKRDAYFALGVREVWLVDQREHSIEVCRAPGASNVETRGFTWRVPGTDVDVDIDVRALFAGVP